MNTINDRQTQFVTLAIGATAQHMGITATELHVRQSLISKHCRTYYYEFRNGERLIPPAVQEEIRQYFREAKWNGDVHFDGFVEDYEW